MRGWWCNPWLWQSLRSVDHHHNIEESVSAAATGEKMLKRREKINTDVCALLIVTLTGLLKLLHHHPVTLYLFVKSFRNSRCIVWEPEPGSDSDVLIIILNDSGCTVRWHHRNLIMKIQVSLYRSLSIKLCSDNSARFVHKIQGHFASFYFSHFMSKSLVGDVYYCWVHLSMKLFI